MIRRPDGGYLVSNPIRRQFTGEPQQLRASSSVEEAFLVFHGPVKRPRQAKVPASAPAKAETIKSLQYANQKSGHHSGRP
jgi:hypothetical protein